MLLLEEVQVGVPLKVSLSKQGVAARLEDLTIPISYEGKIYMSPVIPLESKALEPVHQEPATRTAPQMALEEAPPVAPPVASSLVATVKGVDRPDGCLRIRQGPGSGHPKVGCVAHGAQVQLTGNLSPDGRWAEISSPAKGWVHTGQISSKSSLKSDADSPARAPKSRPNESGVASRDEPVSASDESDSLDEETADSTDSSEEWAGARGHCLNMCYATETGQWLAMCVRDCEEKYGEFR
jgi:hypothetical protein